MLKNFNFTLKRTKKYFFLNFIQKTESTVGVAFVFALVGGWMNRRFGRRIAIIVSSFFFGLGAIMLAIARTFIELLLGRAVLGIGLGTLGLIFLVLD